MCKFTCCVITAYFRTVFLVQRQLSFTRPISQFGMYRYARSYFYDTLPVHPFYLQIIKCMCQQSLRIINCRAYYKKTLVIHRWRAWENFGKSASHSAIMSWLQRRKSIHSTPKKSDDLYFSQHHLLFNCRQKWWPILAKNPDDLFSRKNLFNSSPFN